MKQTNKQINKQIKNYSKVTKIVHKVKTSQAT